MCWNEPLSSLRYASLLVRLVHTATHTPHTHSLGSLAPLHYPRSLRLLRCTSLTRLSLLRSLTSLVTHYTFHILWTCPPKNRSGNRSLSRSQTLALVGKDRGKDTTYTYTKINGKDPLLTLTEKTPLSHKRLLALTEKTPLSHKDFSHSQKIKEKNTLFAHKHTSHYRDNSPR